MEKESNFKSIESQENHTPKPSTLDVIEIDGRLAQHAGSGIVVFLDNKESIFPFPWNDYRYERTQFFTVRDLVENDLIDKQKWENITWGSEQNEMPNLRNSVTFFGKYEKKK